MTQLENCSFNMKTTLSVLVAAICLTVSPGDAASMEGAFVNATRILPVPEVTYYPVNGTATKEEMIAAVSSYLVSMSNGLGYQTGTSAQALYNTMSHMVQGVEFAINQVQGGFSPSFDAPLRGLADCYRKLSAAVTGGLKSTKDFSSQGSSRTGAGQHREYRIWTLEEAFVHLPEMVAPELERLRDWIVDFATVGISNATAELPAIMEELREQSLYPVVRVAMLNADESQQRYDQMFHEYSSPDVYSEFAAAREELLALEIA